jgi:transposase-like protein
MGKRGRLYSPEFRAETVRLVQASDEDHLVSKISNDLDVPTEALRKRVNQTEIDSGQREGLTTEEREEARCRDGTSCNTPPVWNKQLDRPINGRCRMHGGLSTGPKTLEGRRRIAESNRTRNTRYGLRGG